MKRTLNQLTRREFLDQSTKSGVALLAATQFAGAAYAANPLGQPISGEFDLILRGGMVDDGTGRGAVSADVGIKRDRIAAIGTITGVAARVIDARGLLITPGFIDVHTHCDETFRRTGLKRYLAYVMPSWKGNYNYVTQGVTTVITGNCGYGYTDTDQWLSLADGVSFGTNVAHLAPHGMIRESLFGKEPRIQLTAAEMRRFQDRVAEELQKGAVGLSTGLGYAPGVFTPTEELTALARVVQQHGSVLTSHIRDEKGRPHLLGGPGVCSSIAEMLEVARQAECALEISHLKIKIPFDDVTPERILALIEGARAEGLDVHADQYPYAAGSTLITSLLPPEFLTSDGIKEQYKTKGGRKGVQAAITETFSWFPPEKTLITMYDERPEYEGKTIQEVAEREGRSAAESYVDMVCSDSPPLGVFFQQDMGVVRALMPRDYVITASDGWTVPKDMTRPHPRVYGTFPRKIRQFVLDEQVMELTLAIRSMTSLPARKFNLRERGELEVGHFADVAVLDLASIRDNATYKEPHRYADGLKYVLVNGVLAIDGGKPTGDRGGRTLRRV